MRSLLLLMMLWAAVGALGCAGGTEYVVIGGANAPSVAGTLEVAASEQGSDVEVALSFASPPESLGAGLTQYVAWALPPSGPAQRIVTLAYAADERSATGSGSGPSLPFTLLVTAEASPAPESPSEHVVLEKPLAVK